MITLIHPTAVIHPKAQLHPSVQVGAYAVIGENVKVGRDTTIGPHVVIEGWTEIGDRNQIFPGAVIGTEPQDLKYTGAKTFVKIGNDNLIREYVTINRATDEGQATILGNQNLLMAYSHLAHNCVIENQVIIANSVALAGYVHIESQARISGLVGVHQFVHIGKLAMIAGLTRIVQDVPPFMIVEGTPPKVRSLNTIGLKRAGFTPEDLVLLKKAFRILYRSGYRLEEALQQLELLPAHPNLQHLSRFMRSAITSDRRGLVPGKRSLSHLEEM
ncbi:acyl-[acyl-carrier-protein]-UDP-N-acetylglucosamine O-acyltransferase [Lyngbya aestuarii BL J]|uniref:Acyl-[acyl-carrier-protein]--UDP-N-acetylglucosamine O-acyltransferase n=1 Tax=Lyngbya aestuarii BL J TaxID=1348334 RepID=U7QEL7_9CYAN|nr:acyl-ACP--UDP-N-acetylglucosamine O-acyltransferase [Lyngbya aestuarii]ERT05515.1 acyl-[acyl-carrier-protein]-UDP-N-acetylglucosamine O-acyltransferase [Lyngbya aestuarii BL J]